MAFFSRRSPPEIRFLDPGVGEKLLGLPSSTNSAFSSKIPLDLRIGAPCGILFDNQDGGSIPIDFLSATRTRFFINKGANPHGGLIQEHPPLDFSCRYECPPDGQHLLLAAAQRFRPLIFWRSEAREDRELPGPGLSRMLLAVTPAKVASRRFSRTSVLSNRRLPSGTMEFELAEPPCSAGIFEQVRP